VVTDPEQGLPAHARQRPDGRSREILTRGAIVWAWDRRPCGEFSLHEDWLAIIGASAHRGGPPGMPAVGFRLFLPFHTGV